MKAYYEDDFVTIHHGDSWALAPTLAPHRAKLRNWFWWDLRKAVAVCEEWRS